MVIELQITLPHYPSKINCKRRQTQFCSVPYQHKREMTLYLHCFSASEPEFLRTKYSGFQFLTSRVLNYQTSADFIDHCYYFCTLGDFNKKSQTLFPFLSDGPHYIPFIHFLLSSLSLLWRVFLSLSTLSLIPSLSPPLSFVHVRIQQCLYLCVYVCVWEGKRAGFLAGGGGERDRNK